MGYLSVVLFIIVAIVLLLVGQEKTGLGANGGIIALAYIVLSLIYLIPLIYMTKFVKQAGIACSQSDGKAFNETIKNIGQLFKSMGIITISILALYLVFVIVIAIFGMQGLFK